MRKYSKLVKQIFLFGLVGGISFLIDLTVTSLLYNLLHFPAYLAGIIGFLSAFFFNFPINRKQVFKHLKHDRFKLRTQIILYITLSIFNLIMTALILELMVGSRVFSIEVAKIIMTAMIATWNFLLFKFYIFSKKPDAEETLPA